MAGGSGRRRGRRDATRSCIRRPPLECIRCKHTMRLVRGAEYGGAPTPTAATATASTVESTSAFFRSPSRPAEIFFCYNHLATEKKGKIINTWV